jgi:hypothetical protein
MALSKSSRNLLRAFSIASCARALSLAIFDAENVCARKGTSASAGSEVAVALKILGTEFTSCNECEHEDFSIFSNSASNSGVNGGGDAGNRREQSFYNKHAVIVILVRLYRIDFI